jgi:hypothetical protein
MAADDDLAETVRDLGTLELSSLTLGEMAAVEQASGRSFADILRAGPATQRLMAAYVLLSRHSGRPPSWSELAGLRPFDRKSSPSRSRRAGRSETSSG